MNRASIRAVCSALLLAACSEVQSVQLGELAGSSAGTGSASQDATAAPPTLDTKRDAGTGSARQDSGAVAMDPTTPAPSQPSAADAGATRPDAQTDSRDMDDDDDEDSEESPERPSDEEDAGEPNDD